VSEESITVKSTVTQRKLDSINNFTHQEQKTIKQSP